MKNKDYFRQAAIQSGISAIELLIDHSLHKPEPITANSLMPILSLIVATLKMISQTTETDTP